MKLYCITGKKLCIYAIFCILFGLFRIIINNEITDGLLLYVLGCLCAHKQGFFRSHTGIKMSIGGLVVVGAVATGIRCGFDLFVSNFLKLLDSMVIISIVVRMFYQVLCTPAESELPEDIPILHLIATEFSERDRIILQQILAGDKYESIAYEHGLALSSLKRIIHGLFVKLAVGDRVVFMSRYARYTIVRDEKSGV